VWWYTPVFPALGKLKLEDLEFKASQSYWGGGGKGRKVQTETVKKFNDNSTVNSRVILNVFYGNVFFFRMLCDHLPITITKSYC
jgi:hypothetical protein